MPRYTPPESPCALCGRTLKLQFHHLIPRKVHRRTRFKKHYAKETLAQGVYICRPCHRAVHRFFDEMTLATDYSTLAQLRADPRIQAHVAWAKKQRVARSTD